MDLIEVNGNTNRHPWELSRTACIMKQLKKLGIHGAVLDIGCGDSYFDRRLAAEPELDVYGVDVNLEQEFHEKNLCALNSFDHLPDIKFDFIIMMDVLEHIEDDTAFFRNIIQKYLKPEGTVFITVPAFMKLFSLHDKELKHFRRYEHNRLYNVIHTCELKEIKWSYFYFSLIIGRLLTMNKTENLSGWQRTCDDPITKFITGVLNADFNVLMFLSGIGLRLPGLSLMSVCRRDGS